MLLFAHLMLRTIAKCVVLTISLGSVSDKLISRYIAQVSLKRFFHIYMSLDMDINSL